MNEFYKKLVDLYAGNELPEELHDEFEQAAAQNSALAHEAFTLRRTVAALHNLPAPEFTEESYYRVLMRMQAAGAEIQPVSPEPQHIQYHLPMQG